MQQQQCNAFRTAAVRLYSLAYRSGARSGLLLAWYSWMERSRLEEEGARKGTRRLRVIEHPIQDILEIANGLNARRCVNVFARHLISPDRGRDEIRDSHDKR